MKRSLTRIVFSLLVLGLALLAWHIYLATVINKQLVLIRAAGLPTNGEELNHWQANVPDNQNVALVMTQAFALRRLYPDSRSNLVFNFKPPKRGDPLSSKQVELLTGYVALNEARLKKADEALKLSRSRYPMDCTKLMNTELPHLGWLLEIVELHQFSAILALRSNDMASADSNVATMLAIARTLDHEPCLISQLTRLKFIRMAIETLERRANAAAFAPADITRIETGLENAPVAKAAVIGLIGDRALTIPYFRMKKAEFDVLHPNTKDDGTGLGTLLACNGSVILRVIGYYELDFGTYLMAMNNAISALSNAPPENLRAGGYLFRVGKDSIERQRTLSGSLLSHYALVPKRENEAIALYRLASTALAVESFRNQTGRRPEDLKDLAPKFLSDLPEDPFNGLDLRYRKSEKGYVIYSVGPDQQDDGGLERSDKKLSEDKQSYDITFTVER